MHFIVITLSLCEYLVAYNACSAPTFTCPPTCRREVKLQLKAIIKLLATIPPHPPLSPMGRGNVV